MKIKNIILFILGLGCLFQVNAQEEVNLGSTATFINQYFAPAKKLNQAAEISWVEEIHFSDTLTVKYIVNKRENDESGSRIYGVLQAPLKGGIFIIQKGNEIEGEVFVRDWNKVLRFETRNGQVYLKEDLVEKIICVEKESEKQELETQDQNHKSSAIDIQPLALNTRKLQSYPGAKAVVYIDFDGGMSGQRWANSYNNGVPFYLSPANISSDNEYTIWLIMREDFKPFDINITTDSTIFHQYPTSRRQRIIVTRNNTWNSLSSTGIAYINGFSSGDDPCFSFPSGFSSSNPMSATAAGKLGEVSSHEIGHTFGLSHDGSSSTSYYSGHGNWAPVMGNGYNRNVTQWSKGEYANANQLQDDLAIITKTANGFGYKADDHGNTYATSKALVIATGGIIAVESNNGVIETNTDVDVFKFTTSGGNISLHFGTALPKPNLDIIAKLYNNSNQLIASSDVANLTYADINTSLAAGSYYVSIEGVGYGSPLNTGYSKYASLGYYEISGTIPVSGTVNQSPTVSITAPTNGATYTAPASVAITANAADPDGTISKVEFYNGTTLLNSDNASPYSYAWASVAAGTYSLTAKAYDNSGAVSTSSVVSITVNSSTNQLPTISLTAPTNGSTYTAPANVTITANAADADGTISKVEFYNGTTLLNSDNTSPYSFSWTNVASGTYTLTAKAYDNSGASTVSSGRSITVTSGTSTCSAAAWNPNSIYLGDAGLGAGKGEVVSYNNRQYRAKWWTKNNTPGTSGVWLDLGPCNSPSNLKPVISITSPSNGTDYDAPASVTINASASDPDGTISKVEFYRGSILLNTDNTSPYSYVWTGVPAGDYSLTAKAYDNDGAVTTSSLVSISVTSPANQSPSVSISSPSNGSTFAAPASVTISANASDADGTISKVEFYNGSVLLNTDNTSPYSAVWTGVTTGNYLLTAKAYDNNGAVSTSSVVSITVTSTGGCTAQEWKATSIYVAGDQVQYAGVLYRANWWTSNNRPDLNSGGEGSGKPWTNLGSCASSMLTGTSAGAYPAVIVYPNPATHTVYVEGDDIVSVQIIGTIGETISIVSDSYEIDISSLAPGIYTMRIETKEETIVQRFIKQ